MKKHCSLCKYFYCNNASMYCSHTTKCHKITAAKKMVVNILQRFKKLWI